MKKLLTFLFVILIGIPVCAQTLSKEVEEELKRQAMVRLDELTSHLSFVMSKNGYDNTVKDYHINAALNLFIGKGKSYKDKWGNQQPAARMQVSSLNMGTGAVSVKEYPVSTYLNNLKYLQYDEIRITNSKSTCIGDLYKVGEDEWEAVVSWVQVFVGKRGDMTVYKDTTTKNMVVRMHRKDYEGIVRWSVLLGDTTVAVTQ